MPKQATRPILMGGVVEALHHNLGRVSGFTDDGQWWWDGTTWVATAQVVLPQLPTT